MSLFPLGILSAAASKIFEVEYLVIAGGGGVTLSSADAKLKTAKQFAGASVVFGGSGVYYLIGNLGA